ncbi:MAG TPA: helix-turn-helix domain-containing protein [Chloroflexota bacterium]
MSDTSRERREPIDRWVSIGRACRMLGVNPATLRQWADSGKVRAYFTPGGHRRYAEEDLRRLAEDALSPREALAALLREVTSGYRRISRAALEGQAWFPRYDASALAHCHALGHQLLACLVSYLSATRERERQRLLAEARQLGAAYGEEAQRAGLTAPEATEVFFLFRNPVLEAVAAWMHEHPVPAARVSDAIPRIARFMDEVQLAMLQALTGPLASSAPSTPPPSEGEEVSSR